MNRPAIKNITRHAKYHNVIVLQDINHSCKMSYHAGPQKITQHLINYNHHIPFSLFFFPSAHIEHDKFYMWIQTKGGKMKRNCKLQNIMHNEHPSKLISYTGRRRRNHVTFIHRRVPVSFMAHVSPNHQDWRPRSEFKVHELSSQLPDNICRQRTAINSLNDTKLEIK